MPTFTPPTVLQGSDDPFFGRYKIPVGQSVVATESFGFGDGGYGEGGYGYGSPSYRLTPYPWLGELRIAHQGTDDFDTLIEGVHYFLGGRTYWVTDDIAEALESCGFTTTPDSGYGASPYGDGGFGA